MKMLKTHYQRYKKVDLFTYQSFYEWNYLPFRINELKKKCKEFLNTIFPDETFKVQYFETIFEKSISIINQRNLSKPTTDHFQLDLGYMNTNGTSTANNANGNTTSSSNKGHGISSNNTTFKSKDTNDILQQASYQP